MTDKITGHMSYRAFLLTNWVTMLRWSKKPTSDVDSSVSKAHMRSQGAMSGNYAFGHFRYLTKLLLIHRRWSYQRIAEISFTRM